MYKGLLRCLNYLLLLLEQLDKSNKLKPILTYQALSMMTD